jgi:hypothetical protein
MAVQPSAPKRRVVILEEGMLVGLSNNQQFLNSFPFLKPLRKLSNARSGGCGKCGTAARDRSQIVTQAKMALISLPQGQKDQLKTLLNAEKIQVKYKSGDRIVTQEF